MHEEAIASLRLQHKKRKKISIAHDDDDDDDIFRIVNSTLLHFDAKGNFTAFLTMKKKHLNSLLEAWFKIAQR
jgi:hypothetical protein